LVGIGTAPSRIATEERGVEGGRVVEDHEHALLAADAELAQGSHGLRRQPRDVREGQRLLRADQRRLVGAAGLEVAVEQQADIDPFGRHDGHLRHALLSQR
jgi:hypothetical protein